MPFQSAFAQLFTQNTVIAAVVFGLVLVVLFGAMLVSRRRRRRGLGPSRKAEANKLELGYVGLLAGIVVFLVVSSFVANAKDFPDPPKSVATVEVTGYQWCWRFAYEGTGRTVTGQCQGGAPPVLMVPAGQPVTLRVTSADVIHAFWVPYTRFKTYAYPGQVNTITMTFPNTGRWIGRCAQLCGLYHFNMDFYVQAVPPAAFAAFLRTGRP